MSPEVEAFMTELHQNDADRFDLVEVLYELTREVHPDLGEGIKCGGVMFSLSGDCGGIFPSKHHVSFEFSHGHAMDDPNGILEGSGKFRRHLKIRELADVEAKDVRWFVKQMADG